MKDYSKLDNFELVKIYVDSGKTDLKALEELETRKAKAGDPVCGVNKQPCLAADVCPASLYARKQKKDGP